MAILEEPGAIRLDESRPMNLREAVSSAIEQLAMLIHLEVDSVVSARRAGDGWHLTVELIERKAVPDTQDLLGTYEISLDSNGELMEYGRTDIRRRMDLLETVE